MCMTFWKKNRVILGEKSPCWSLHIRTVGACLCPLIEMEEGSKYILLALSDAVTVLWKVAFAQPLPCSPCSDVSGPKIHAVRHCPRSAAAIFRLSRALVRGPWVTIDRLVKTRVSDAAPAGF